MRASIRRFAMLFLVTAIEAVVDKCSQLQVKVPEQFKMESAQNYRFTESALQIYTNLRIPCDGYIKEWRFLAASPFIYALHLGIFRKKIEPFSRKITFTLVGESHLSAMSTPDGMSGIWVYFPPEEPLPVKTGDYIGIFYEKYAISSELLTIPSKNEYEITDKWSAKTYVFLMDNISMAQNSEYLDIRILLN